jgi:hypothetical protein
LLFPYSFFQVGFRSQVNHCTAVLPALGFPGIESLFMNTAFLLMAQYNGAAIIPVEAVCRDYFTHLTADNFVRKVTAGEIPIPLVRMEAASQKAAKGVHLTDLAAWIDARRAAAVKECQQLQR